MLQRSNRPATALAIALAFVTMALLAPVTTATADGPSAECHGDYWMWTSASDYSVTPGEQVTVTVYHRLGYYYNPAYVRTFANVDGSWSDPVFNWGPIYYVGYCATQARSFTFTAPDTAGTVTLGTVSQPYSWPTLSSYWRLSWLNIQVLAPKLEITRDAASEVDVGEPFTTTLTVRNVGNDAAKDVTLTETAPAFLDTGAASLEWSLGEIPVGQAKTVSYRAVATDRGTGALAAAATGTGSTGFPVAAADGPHVITAFGPEVGFDRTMTGTVDAGEAFDVSVTFTNTGERAASGLSLTDSFPSDYTLAPSDVRVANAGEPGTVSPRIPRVEFDYGAPAAGEHADPITVKGDETTSLTWTLPTLAPGESFTVTYTLIAPARLPYATADEPELPGEPGVPGEPEVPDEPELPAPPATVNDNAGTYAFHAGAAFATTSGFALADAAGPSIQSVRAAHQLEPDQPEVPEDPELPALPPA